MNTATGATVLEREYSPYGALEFSNGSFGQPFGYAGGLEDSLTGLVRFGARDYDPEVGRWTAKDPILTDGGVNLYEYGASAPQMFVDPTGRESIQVGVSVDVCFMFMCFSASAGPALAAASWDDYDWSIAPLSSSTSLSFSTQPVSLDWALFVEGTDADSVDTLQGLEVFAAVGGGEAITGQYDYISGVNTSDCTGPPPYKGHRFSGGIGAGGLPIDVRAGTTIGLNPVRTFLQWAAYVMSM